MGLEIAGSRDVAIIGIACIFPGAPDLATFWQNILSSKDALTDPPETREMRSMYDPSADGEDGIYCKRGGYIDAFASFDPMEYGIMPKAIEGTEPDQWLALRVARAALRDAGYGDEIPERGKTAVVLGKGSYPNHGHCSVIQHGVAIAQTLDILRTLRPELGLDELALLRKELAQSLPRFESDTAPGLIPNVTAGRIANRLNLMGPSFTVDAACASSLVATELAMHYLWSGQCDLALAGAAQLATPVQIRQVFCRLGALSRSSAIRPFDTRADGTLVGDGAAVMVLKRLADAQRDGNRVYAVIKAVGVASDGYGSSVTAPRLEGEMLALRRAYELSGLSPQTVALLEAHGTGTPLGDATEVSALNEVFGSRSRRLPSVALGSVKSMVGHLMAAAGMAGIIKAALALYHKVLPPTLNVTEPIAPLRAHGCPFYVNSELRPWIHHEPSTPRRAGVNAFGFGGINAHAILEECPAEEIEGHRARWETELCILSADSREGLRAALQAVLKYLEQSAEPDLKDLAYTLALDAPPGSSRLAVVASSIPDLREKLARARDRLAHPDCGQIRDPSGIFYSAERIEGSGRVAVVFPGEGSQYPNMLADLCIRFPEVRSAFDVVDGAIAGTGSDVLLSECVFPGSSWGASERALAADRLWQMRGAVGSVLAADIGLLHLLERFKIRPDGLVAHSAGEYAAMMACGVVDTSLGWDGFAKGLADAYVADVEQPGSYTLAAVAAGCDSVSAAVEAAGSAVQIAMDNCNLQTVIAGPSSLIDEILGHFQNSGILCERLKFSRPYHTEAFRPCLEPLRRFLDRCITCSPTMPVYSCTTKAPWPSSVAELKAIALEHWVRPVAFRGTIQNMYEDGFRIFVEVGARGNLSAFIRDILRGKSHAALPANVPGRPAITSLQHLLGALFAEGVPLDLGYLFSSRSPHRVDLKPGAERSAPAPEPRMLAVSFPHMHLPADIAESVIRKLNYAGTAAGGVPAPALAETGAPAVLTPAVALKSRTAVPRDVSEVMKAHFRNMEQFLDLQREIIQSHLVRRNPPPEQPENPRNRCPLISRILSLDPGERATALCDIDLAGHAYLKDHTLGLDICSSDAPLPGTRIVPLMFAVEMMAEVASLIANGPCLTSLRQIRAHRFLEPPVKVILRATRTGNPNGEIQVSIHEHSDTENGNSSAATPVVNGRFIFAASYKDAPLIQETKPGSSTSSFKQVTATLEVLPRNGLIASDPTPEFFIDPVLLNAAGQLVRRNRQGGLYFPFFLEEIECYAPPLEPGETVNCDTRFVSQTPEVAEVDICLGRPDGHVVATIGRWCNHRLAVSSEIVSYWCSPGNTMLAPEWEVLGIPEGVHLHGFEIAALPDDFFTWGGGISERAVINAALSVPEKLRLESAGWPEARRIEWLFGRIAAKDAVRHYLEKRYHLRLSPIDVEIKNDEQGGPLAGGSWTATCKPPAVSISHSGQAAIAVVGDFRGLGVGVEALSPHTVPEIACTVSSPEEQVLLAMVPRAKLPEWRLRLWCAKKAAAKTLGWNLGLGYLPLKAATLDFARGLVDVQSQSDSAVIRTRTMVHRGLMIAVAAK